MTTPRVLAGHRADAGVSIVELGISMFITSLLAVGLVTWIASGAESVLVHESDDIAVQDLRVTKEVMSRELRRAAGLVGAESNSVTVWLDDDADLVVDAGEHVTWTFGSGGSLVRSTDDGESILIMDGLVVSESGFAFDDVDVDDITLIRLTLVAHVDDSQRTISTEIHLRSG
ncbi:MAG: hypothetical protein WD184_00290 [Acidimicrobiia bacterium]